MDWNEDAIARLRALWDEGLSTAEIGRRLGITKNAVVGKAHRLTLPARPSPIRRSAAGVAPRRPAVRRVVGPTLSPAPKVPEPPVVRAPPQAPVPHGLVSRDLVPAVAVAPGPRTLAAVLAAVPAAPVLRAVPASPRPAGRVPACCWPIGEPGTPSFHFCGAGAVAGKPYCAEHVAIAYVKVRDRREDAA